MQTPYYGKATINPVYNGVQIIIPANTNSFVLMFLGLAFAGFLALEAFDPNHIFHSADNGQTDTRLMLQTTAIAFGIFALAATWWWYLSGAEVITFSAGEVSICKKRTPGKTKTYNLNQARNFRAVSKTANYIYALQRGRRRSLWRNANIGAIQFDYGNKTIKFAGELDEAEAGHLLQMLREKKLIG